VIRISADLVLKLWYSSTATSLFASDAQRNQEIEGRFSITATPQDLIPSDHIFFWDWIFFWEPNRQL
jgi:hypothetical protein